MEFSSWWRTKKRELWRKAKTQWWNFMRGWTKYKEKINVIYFNVSIQFLMKLKTMNGRKCNKVLKRTKIFHHPLKRMLPFCIKIFGGLPRPNLIPIDRVEYRLQKTPVTTWEFFLASSIPMAQNYPLISGSSKASVDFSTQSTVCCSMWGLCQMRLAWPT